jgi:hypothetical protein
LRLSLSVQLGDVVGDVILVAKYADAVVELAA